MRKIEELQIGVAGEHLVCADLITKGYPSFLSDQGLHYDVVCDYEGSLIRIQVKTTRTHRATPQRKNYTPAYLFQARRCGKGGRKRYKNKDIDLMALVVLEKKKIGYLPVEEVKIAMQFRTKEHQYQDERGTYLEDLSFERAIKIAKARIGN